MGIITLFFSSIANYRIKIKHLIEYAQILVFIKDSVENMT